MAMSESNDLLKGPIYCQKFKANPQKNKKKQTFDISIFLHNILS